MPFSTPPILQKFYSLNCKRIGNYQSNPGIQYNWCNLYKLYCSFLCIYHNSLNCKFHSSFQCNLDNQWCKLLHIHLSTHSRKNYSLRKKNKNCNRLYSHLSNNQNMKSHHRNHLNKQSIELRNRHGSHLNNQLHNNKSMIRRRKSIHHFRQKSYHLHFPVLFLYHLRYCYCKSQCNLSILDIPCNRRKLSSIHRNKALCKMHCNQYLLR